MNTNVMSGIFALLAGSSAGLLGQQPPGTQLWMYEAGAGHLIQGSPAVSSDGTVYFSVLGNLYAITNGGSNKWSFPLQTGGDNVYSSPAIGSDGTIYVASGELYAINPDGSQKWTYPAGAGDGSPAIGPDNA